MTSQDRELAIADNIVYVRAVVEHARAGLRAPGGSGAVERPLVFLGFSQGVAMAFRAAAHVAGCRGVIALGGDIPPEVRASDVGLPPVLLARGKDDGWYTRGGQEADLQWLRVNGVDMTTCAFDGGHVWTDAFRAEAGRFLDRRRSTGA